MVELILAIIGGIAVAYIVIYGSFALVAAWLFSSAMSGKRSRRR